MLKDECGCHSAPTVPLDHHKKTPTFIHQESGLRVLPRDTTIVCVQAGI